MRRFLTLTLALAIVACGSDSSSAPSNASVAGTWTLQTVNGSPLPFTLASSPAKLELLSYVVTVTSNGTWTSAQSIRTTFNGQATTATTTDAGTYTLSGNAVAIQSSSSTTVLAGTVSGNTLTLAQPGLTFVFQKQ